MTHQWNIAGSVALFALAAACAGTKTKEPVVTTSGGESKVSESGTAAAQRGKSLVRLINAIPGDRSIDITGDDRAVFYNVEYKSVTPYTEIGDNLVKFRLRGAGTDTVWADNTETLANGNRYTIVAVPNSDGGARLLILKDDVVPDPGKARLRVVQAAPELTSVDVSIEGQKDPIFKGVSFGAGAGFNDIDPTNVALVVHRIDPPGTVLRVTRRLEAGKSYTIVLTGTGSSPITPILVIDALRTYAIQ